MRETIVVVSVDTEEDNWRAARDGITVENIRELPRLQTFCDRLGIPLTYFATYQVVATPWAAAVLRDLRATGRAEVAAHLHPWHTPPLDEPFVPRNTMLKNLPGALQGAKLATLSRTIEEAFGFRPQVFRAGRYGLGRETTQVLIEQGYRVDGSVTPWVSWAATDEGANFVGAPLSAYTLDGSTDPRDPVAGGPLLEIPLSSGYTRAPFEVWDTVHRTLRSPWVRPLRLTGAAALLGVFRKTMLTPETSSVRDMLRLARCLVEGEVAHLSIMLHSSSLSPGLTPFGRTDVEVQALYQSLAEFAESLGRFTTPVFVTFGDAAARLTPQQTAQALPRSPA